MSFKKTVKAIFGFILTKEILFFAVKSDGIYSIECYDSDIRAFEKNIHKIPRKIINDVVDNDGVFLLTDGKSDVLLFKEEYFNKTFLNLIK
jgi:hypothetical protein